jgi:hypothetical protein
MPYQLCRHIKTDGRRCQAPALRSNLWCFFHARLHFRHRSIRPESSRLPPAADCLKLPALEDSGSIQVALSVVVNALAIGYLDEKRARALLHGLSIAAKHVHNANPAIRDPSLDQPVDAFTPTVDGLELAPERMSDGTIPSDPIPSDPIPGDPKPPANV